MTNFLEKRTNNSFFLRVNVKPNSKKQDIFINGDFLTIQVRSKALQNKANKEVLNLLRKKLNVSSNQLHIVLGSKNTNKTIQILFSTEIDEKEIIKRLLA
jgi:uncharacterized protein (TIGR00251 family)